MLAILYKAVVLLLALKSFEAAKNEAFCFCDGSKEAMYSRVPVSKSLMVVLDECDVDIGMVGRVVVGDVDD